MTVIHDSPEGFYIDMNFIIFLKNATKREMVVVVEVEEGGVMETFCFMMSAPEGFQRSDKG